MKRKTTKKDKDQAKAKLVREIVDAHLTDVQGAGIGPCNSCHIR